MKKPLLAAAAALALAGCNVSQNEIDTARAGYNAAFLTPAAHYRALGDGHGNPKGYCAAGTVATLALPCADRATVAKLRAQDVAVHAALTNLQAMETAGNTSGATAAFSVLQIAVAAAEATALNLGVK